ncbi:MAG: hypothetical protein WKG32_18140 [Gemmatimonadaceae bacterium]
MTASRPARAARPRARHALRVSLITLLAACRAGTAAMPASSAAPAGAPRLAGTVLVANQQAASASVIDLASGTTATIAVGTGPHETAISPDGRWGVVTIYGTQPAGNQLAVIDMATRAVVRTVDLGRFTRPHGAAFLPGAPGQVAVTSEATQTVVIVDIAAGRVADSIATQNPGSHMLGVTANGKRLYTANIPGGTVSEIDLERRAFVRQIAVGAPATEGVAVTPDGRTVWVGSNQAHTVSVVDVRTGIVTDTLTGFGIPYRIGISPDGRWAVICDQPNGKIHIASVATRKVVGEIAGLGSPRGVSIAPDGRLALVTLGQGEVAAVDLAERRELKRFPVGASPDGVAYTRTTLGR